MMIQKKLDSAMKWLKEKYSSSEDRLQEIDRGELKLESKDVIAIILSAIMVFGPVILILFIIAILMYI